MDNRDFEAFYSSLINSEQRVVIPSIKNSTLSKDRKHILDNLYLKEVCRFIYEEGRFEFGAGLSEALVQYLVNGELRLCNMNEYLYDNAKYTNEHWLYANLFQNASEDKRIYRSSLASFFSDIVSRINRQFNNGVESHIMDFNLMLHLFIMKTRAMKCNTDNWNGVNLSDCKKRSTYTEEAFHIFRFQYNQQIVNEVDALIRMTLNSLATFEKGLTDTRSLGMLDHVALDMLGQRYRFDNMYNILEPNLEELDKHNRKILRIYEKRAKGFNLNYTDPTLRVYLCSADSFQYIVTKQLAMYYGVSFPEVYSLLRPITSWSDETKLASKLARITAKFEKEKENFERRLDVAEEAIRIAKEQRKVGIVDEDFYEMCTQYYIPNMEFVIYNWNMNTFEDVSSEVEIDFRKVYEREGENFEKYLSQLYHAGQNINILRRLIIKDNKFMRVTVRNVPFAYSSRVEELLQRETRSVNSKYGSKFCYLYTLDNAEALAIAKANLKNGGNAERDAYLQKYKGVGVRERKKHKFRYIYPSGAKHKFIRYKYRKSDWRMARKGSKVLGRRRIIKGLDIIQSYFEMRRKIGDEESKD